MALVTLRSYRDPIDAELDKARLDAADIPSVVLDEGLVGLNWLYSDALGGVKLKVHDSALEAAREVVSQTDASLPGDGTAGDRLAQALDLLRLRARAGLAGRQLHLTVRTEPGG